jgi:hypothetical protein
MAGDLIKALGRAMADERREAPAVRLSVRGAARARFLTKSILACFRIMTLEVVRERE